MRRFNVSQHAQAQDNETKVATMESNHRFYYLYLCFTKCVAVKSPIQAISRMGSCGLEQSGLYLSTNLNTKQNSQLQVLSFTLQYFWFPLLLVLFMLTVTASLQIPEWTRGYWHIYQAANQPGNLQLCSFLAELLWLSQSHASTSLTFI